jgi:acetoin utilization deacetylase AcuC-like enzyme
MEKYDLLPQQLMYEGLIESHQLFEPSGPISESDILLSHHPEYWNKLKNLDLSRQEIRKTGFPLSQALIDRERIIMQGTLDCIPHAFKNGVSLNIAGGTHHAYTNRGEGFCLLNDLALGAHHLLHHGQVKRIMIIDLDVHQGNGTAEIFSNENRVFTLSMHGEKNYPLHKEKSDLDIPVWDGIGDRDYLTLLQEHLAPTLDHFQPEFCFYQCGVDVLKSDKLGRLGLSIDACKTRDRMVFTALQEREIPVVCAMGGGYSEDIKIIIEAHANTFRLADELYS